VTARREFSLDGGDVLAYGHFGRPMLAFPSEQGPAWQYEERGMIAAVERLLDAGRVKVYCVSSYDSASWHAHDLPLEQRARRHEVYERWIVDRVVPWIVDDCAGIGELIATGCSFGAYHAANFALKRADLFPLAICQSGVYDVSVVGWGDRGDAVYFNNPADYVAHLHGDHLDWLRSRVSLLLVCGRG
jgi:esterase/lipase superfamily enzyme